MNYPTQTLNDYTLDIQTIDIVSQWLQDNGYLEASKAIDCEFEL